MVLDVVFEIMRVIYVQCINLQVIFLYCVEVYFNYFEWNLYKWTCNCLWSLNYRLNYDTKVKIYYVVLWDNYSVGLFEFK